MKFEHVYFNAEYWKGKSLQRFKRQEGHHGLSEKKLEEAFYLINPPKAKEPAGVKEKE